MSTDRLYIFDTTLRDGEQAPGFSLRTEQKLRLARQLEALGVDIMEVGFPVASEDDARAVELIAREVREPVIATLGRCRPGDIDLVGGLVRGAARLRIHTFIATSDLHLEHKLRPSREECLRAVEICVARARGYTDDVEFSAEDAIRSDMDFLCRVVDTAIAAGATTINLPDTVGYSVPSEITAFFRAVMARVSDADGVIFSAHCHDDLGLAVANSLAAVLAGVRQLECTVNGIGERAGNASLEEVVMATRVRRNLLPFETRIDTTELFRTSQLLTELTGEPVQANKAIVGRNAFAHEAGIHQHDPRPAHLRDHEPGGRRRAVDSRAREALGAPRGAKAVRGAGIRAGRGRARPGLSRGDRHGRPGEVGGGRGAGRNRAAEPAGLVAGPRGIVFVCYAL